MHKIQREAAAYWVDEAADVEIVNGLAVWRMSSGGWQFVLRATPAVMLESIRRATAAYNAFAEKNGAEVVRLRKKGKRRH